MKVLVVQQRYGIGDMLIFLPYLKALSEKNNVKISLLAKKHQDHQSYLNQRISWMRL